MVVSVMDKMIIKISPVINMSINILILTIIRGHGTLAHRILTFLIITINVEVKVSLGQDSFGKAGLLMGKTLIVDIPYIMAKKMAVPIHS